MKKFSITLMLAISFIEAMSQNNVASGTDITGYTQVASENQSISIDGYADVAFGANGSFRFLYNVSGTIVFDNVTFGDPVPGVIKFGYLKRREASAQPQVQERQSSTDNLQNILLTAVAASAQEAINEKTGNNQSINAALTTLLASVGQQQSIQQLLTSLGTEQAQLLVGQYGNDNANALLNGLVSSSGDQQVQLIRQLIVTTGKENAQDMVSRLLGGAGNEQFQTALSQVYSNQQQINTQVVQQMSTVLPANASFFTNGLMGSYYDNLTNLSQGLPATAAYYENVIDFDWGVNAPNQNIPPDNFMIKWEGNLVAPATGDYTIYAIADDGVQVVVNNSFLINAWQDQGPTEYQGTVFLNAGVNNSFSVYYYERGGGALVKVYISGPGIPKQIIR